jgi:predicted ATPase
MDGERWRLVSALFAEAEERDPGARPALLAAVDSELRREVESLLAAHAATGAVDRLAGQVDDLRSVVLASRTGSSRTASGDRPEAPFLLEPGRRLGRHEIRARLGAGGMGEVYRAFDTRLEREVAIKILRRRARRRPGALVRFEQEARAASALNHPHIVTVHDIGEEASFPYLVMELVEGQSLRRRLDGPLPVERLLTWAVHIADGLVAAHERQVVHGDIKPENILVTDRGIAKIVDFGLAHFWMPDAALEDDAHAGPLGRQTTLLGTPGYLSPEVVRGEPLDQRSDQFSLGATLYEMATGARAFAGRTVLEILAGTLFDDPPSLAEARPDLPAELIQAVERCLRKDQSERYPSTRELLEELRALRRAPVVQPRAEARRRPVALPAQRTRLIGRQREIQEIERMLGEKQVRLLTLTGPGGTGKTRLALSAAEVLSPRFPGGVFFVHLASLTDAALVAPTIAHAIGAVVAAGQPSLAAVIDDRRGAGATLLLLDNFEQVIDAGAAVGELLAACPDLTIMVTSREVLRLYGEQLFPVVALELPDPARLPAPRELAECPAIALFVERAQAVNPTFALGADNAAAVAALCAGLDGLPLALELAAAQTRSHSPQSMLARLQDRLGLLTGGARDLPGRQQTLRRTLDWSHQLLVPTEQAVFRRLAVFAGGFTLEAAQAVADPFAKLDLPVAQAIAALVDKSLLQSQEPTGADEPRFVMLETLREYAREKLDASAEAERTQEAHAAYFLVLGEEGSVALTSTDEPRWLPRFETEHDNFRAALEWLTRRGRAEWGMRLGLALFRFWERGEHLAEGRRRLHELIALAGTPAWPALQARVLFAAGVLASDQGDAESGVVLHERSLELFRGLGDRWGIAVALVALGNQSVARDDHEGARRFLEESLPIWGELGDDAAFARSLSNLAFAARAEGCAGEARDLYRKAAAMLERMGDRLSHAWAINHEGDLAREQGDLEAAESLCERALATFRSLEHGWGIGTALTDLGTIARQRKDHGAARRHYHQALASFIRLDHRRGIARLLECLAVLAGEEGQPERGLKLAATAASLRDRVGGATPRESRGELARSLTAMNLQLGAGPARLLWQEGAAMPVAEALRLAVSG